ncbi:tRNA (adenosine(37)-N6)-threonylcarbamoyltransferase complex ATPase subunit type 1 TsaE [Luteimonas yindakuii]|uniref:tRNA (adenosine(37)-N6)-threonylcarbamoyltransferase complex ATPase subunit type 1 TsaE n=1 Tax=Luteimonas yindakuii TaxID=2565782 RepID=UPI001FC9D6CC|nr:tRNA (adenosine(37)-N6)-threonylcarbamoyltransferase complex ATPase subunit type 1 TsaE [Luteimonas yindakuii]
MNTGSTYELQLDDAAATEALAWRLADSQPRDGAVVHLHGDLGAGKSTLARAWLRRLGVEGTVRSPTYTLVERYPLASGGEALHLDLYRIGDPGELEFLGLDEAGGALWLVEWPQRGAGALPPADLAMHLALAAQGRALRIEACSAKGREWVDRLRDGEVVTVS